LSEPPHYRGLREVAGAIARREISPVELAEGQLARIAEVEPGLNALLWRNPHLLRDARRVQTALARGKPAGPLPGVPITLKDLILTRAQPTTAGSRTFGEGLRADQDAPVVRRLLRTGAILLGKTNLHELAMGVTTINEHFGPSRNPWDPARIAGGSSGGSAVALAAGMGYGSVGTDTRGSIRIPSACCGVTGLKPTRDVIPTDGVIPLSPTLDHVGPMARSVEDVALLLGVMRGSSRAVAECLTAVDRVPGLLRIGVCSWYLDHLDRPIEAAVGETIATLARLGHRVVSIEIPGLAEAHGASGVITGAEALAFHKERLRQHPEGFGSRVRARLEAAQALTAVDLVRAEAARRRTAAAFAEAFEEVDCLVGAVLPADPPVIEQADTRIGAREETLLDAFTRLNAPQNMAGVPALTVPGGMSPSGIPIGVQLIAGRGRDALLLGLGAQYQRETDWHFRAPPP
jgi:aspartyl-tRNA(Asn)/glutamyl-tRNA(Gln) amidotransferase subunit A